MTDEQPDVLYDIDDHMATITLNRSERMNSFSPGLLGGSTAWIEPATEDSTEGPGAFREQRTLQLQGR